MTHTHIARGMLLALLLFSTAAAQQFPPGTGPNGALRPIAPRPPIVRPPYGPGRGFYPPPVTVITPPPPRIADYAWNLPEPLPPREIKVQDLITIIVDEKSEVLAQAEFQRQQANQFTSAIEEFVRIGPRGTLENAANNSPTVDLSTTSRTQNRARLTDREGVRYRITATVADILPNGNIVLEARKTVRSNDDVWHYTLSGVVRPQDIAVNNTALSEHIANLQIARTAEGKIADSTKRRWGTKVLDNIWPF